MSEQNGDEILVKVIDECDDKQISKTECNECDKCDDKQISKTQSNESNESNKKISITDLTWDMHNFVTSKGWYDTNSTRQQTPRNIAVSLSLEVAEVLEHFQWGDWVNSSTNKQLLAGELADVSLYLFQLASLTGIDLETAIRDKLTENHKREWSE
jgi:NTP pyrophosphatase (non-canonical NTP hydrolase)